MKDEKFYIDMSDKLRTLEKIKCRKAQGMDRLTSKLLKKRI